MPRTGRAETIRGRTPRCPSRSSALRHSDSRQSVHRYSVDVIQCSDIPTTLISGRRRLSVVVTLSRPAPRCQPPMPTMPTMPVSTWWPTWCLPGGRCRRWTLSTRGRTLVYNAPAVNRPQKPRGWPVAGLRPRPAITIAENTSGRPRASGRLEHIPEYVVILAPEKTIDRGPDRL